MINDGFAAKFDIVSTKLDDDEKLIFQVAFEHWLSYLCLL